MHPRTGTTFYVGMGQGNRVFQQHAKRKFQRDAECGHNLARRILREIEEAALEPLRIVHHSGTTKDQAGHVEKALIAAYPGVTNRKPKDGPKNARELVRRLEGD